MFNTCTQLVCVCVFSLTVCISKWWNKFQAAQIAAEEAKFEEARQAAVSELRRQLAAETEEALRVQDQEIGLLIGRLQVG